MGTQQKVAAATARQNGKGFKVPNYELPVEYTAWKITQTEFAFESDFIVFTTKYCMKARFN